MKNEVNRSFMNMKKKIYNQPIVDIAEALQPMAIVCASIQPGPPADSDTIGD